MLLEREPALQALQEVLAEAGHGAGRVAWIGGEAGIGKTTLLREFAQRCGAVPVHWGACDPLFTPRPLAPLHDMAATLGEPVRQALARDAARVELFSAVREAIGRGPCVLVFEDVHWADEATLDLLAWLGRRIDATHTLLIASYRDDEVGPRHPLRRVFGAVTGAVRIALPRLSVDAVRRLAADSAVDALALFRISGGNPFYVTEVLAVGDAQAVPPTVSDAVMARLASLTEAARQVLDAAAVLGPRIDPALLQSMAGTDAASIDACLSVGVLQDSAGALEFRHELARRAVFDALSSARRQALHRRVLDLLKAAPVADSARLAEHAEAAGDRDAVLTHAPQAAREALALGARRQAFDQYARALRFAAGLPDGERAALLEAYALVCLGAGEGRAGVAARREAIALRARRGEVREQAESLCRLTNLLIGMGASAEADEALRQAFELLEPLPACRELAYAWRTRAHLAALRSDDAVGIEASDRAIELAERFGDLEIQISALNTKGATIGATDVEAGCALLERSRALAARAGRAVQVFNAEINLGDCVADAALYARAERHYRASDALANDLQMERVTTQSRLALCALHLGRWDEAGDYATRALAESPDMQVNGAVAQRVLGLLRARRGDASAWPALDAALATATRLAQIQHLAPVRAARAEAAWLEGDLARCRAEATADYALALVHPHPWFVGMLCFWQHLGGAQVETPGIVALPYALQIAGRHREAAAQWRDRGCPYEEALALAGGDETAQREALAIFERLGARPAADALRSRLHAAGVRGLARGPRASTREHPFGLTNRELQMLQLLCEGLRNAEIAARVHRSVRTVDHHLAAVFAKLGVESRAAAIAAAQRAGLTKQSGQLRSAK